MKLLVILAFYITLSYGNSISRIPYDNSHYVDGVSRYIWMSRDDGEQTLVDLHESVDNLENTKAAGANNQYWLYTRQNPDDYQLLVHGESSSVINSYFQADKMTKVVVHGWNNNGADSVYNQVMRNSLLDAEDCNVIAVDYRDIGSALYVVAVNGVPSVGESLGTFLDWLLKETGGDWNNVHLLGYSLGAHVIGNAARIVDGRPARLTGFDPAGPLWHMHPNRLDSSNAQYVEAIHTNGGVMGILSPVGHVDFYPNGGVIQPGCFSNNCFHDRSYQFFAASINTGHLVGRKCENISEALNNSCTGTPLQLGGIDINKRGSGIFGMRTGRAWPF
ncbi:unnamed protein product [Diatraea saccharalis]|uniref:Lipase domain-containing protein n=1 Tax=Diatraea saccharalis TaxID=40085 RepID=A0A9N9WLS5_9NEOP|nr:unnamed protein product [Diatraea saccharalis]